MADEKLPERGNDAETGDANRDPITGTPGAHPVGTGLGAAGGGAAGAAIGAVGGPVGAVVGTVVGAVAGGLAGKGVAESIDPTVEDAHWRENYRERPYVQQGETYDEYAPAYRYGWESRGAHEGRTFDEVEPELARNWEGFRQGQNCRLDWGRARNASRDAWERINTRGTGGA